MKRHLFPILLLLICLGPRLSGKEIYVAKNGSDTNDGSFEAPYQTIAKASTQAFPGDIVYIREGVYEETLKSTRSGSPGNPITYMPYNGEKVVISAMEALNGWTLDEGMVYKTQVSWDLGQQNFVMNGDTACDLARWPNNTDGDPFTLNSLRNSGGSGSTVASDAYLDYHAGIPDFDWSKGGSVFFYCDKAGWTAWKAFIKSSTGIRVTFDLNKNPAWIRTEHPPGDLGDFYLEGIREAIDYDNEWYFDPGSRTLYIQLPDGAEPGDGQISMRKRITAIDLLGKEYIVIKNIQVFGGSIRVTGSHNHLYGVYSYYGNHTRGVVTGFSANSEAVLLTGSHNTMEKCEIAYGAATGVKFEGTNNRIINSSIHDFDYLGNYDAPVNMRGGSYSKLIQNTIYRGGRDCVQMFNKNSELAYNDIYRSNLIADDCGLMYTVGGPFNMTIHHNWLHDTRSRGSNYKAAGIYLDNNAEDFLVHHNVVWNTEWSSIQCNLDCKDLDIFNNTFWDGSAAMGAWHRDGTSFSNVKVYNNLANDNQWEPQSDKQNNLTVYNDPFVDRSAKNFQLKPGSAPVDYGRVISGITGTHYGLAPDAGAYEQGGPTWKAGIDWDPLLGPDVCSKPGVYLEKDGYVLIEAESAAKMGKGWTIVSDEVALGGTYLEYTGDPQPAYPEDSTISTYYLEITHPGTYEFRWRSREAGSSWIQIDCDHFLIKGNGSTYSIDTAFVKVNNNSLQEWSWESFAEWDGSDSLRIFATFEHSGIYHIRVAGGSQGTAIDRLALFMDIRNGIALDNQSVESVTSCLYTGDGVFWASSRIAEVTLSDTGFEIDGLEEAEWQYSDTLQGSFNPGSPVASDPEDLSFAFRLAYDAEYLYFLARVQDDVLSSWDGNSGNPENWDHIKLYFNPDGLHNPLGRYGEDANMIRLNYGIREDHLASMETDEGYILEARIAWDSITPGGITPGPLILMGFEVQVNDRDLGDGIEDWKAWANDTDYQLSDVDTRKFGHLRLKEVEYKYVNKTGWEVIYADSEETPGSKDRLIDGKAITHWGTWWRGGQDPLPHEVQIDFKQELDVKEVHYLPRQDASAPEGAIGAYEIYMSHNDSIWGLPVAKGEISWPDDLDTYGKDLQIIRLDKVSRGRYFRLVILSEAHNDPEIQVTAIAELDVVLGEYMVGLEEMQDRANQIRIYPNPSSGEWVNLSFPEKISEAAVSIYALDGKEVLSRKLHTGNLFSLNMESLPSGMYLIRVTTPDQNLVKPLIKQ
jgi:hypothetical protein